MKKFVLAGLMLLGLASPAYAVPDCSGAAIPGMIVGTDGSLCYYLKLNSDGSLNVTGAFTPSGTQDINAKQVNGATINVGPGAAGTGTMRVTTSTDSVTTVTAITNALPAGTNVIGHTINDTGSTTAVTGNVTVIQPTGTNLHTVLDTTSTTAVTQPTGTNLHAVLDTTSTTAVTQATGTNLHAVLDSGTLTTLTTLTGITNALPTGTNLMGKVGIDQTTAVTTNGVIIAPTSSANASPSAIFSSALETGHVIKASAGNLYSVYAYSSVAGFLMVFNSTTVPAAGAVTPTECIPIVAGGFGAHELTDIPDQYSTGISVAFSSNASCFTKTDSATAFFRVRYQ